MWWLCVESELGGYRARAAKYLKRDGKEVTTCGSTVVPELRFASFAKTRVVEKRLPHGDRFRRANKRGQKERKQSQCTAGSEARELRVHT